MSLIYSGGDTGWRSGASLSDTPNPYLANTLRLSERGGACEGHCHLVMDDILNLCAYPDLTLIGKYIKEGDMTTRKHILLLGRHQGLPQGFGNMYNITKPTVDKLVGFFMKHSGITSLQLPTYDPYPIYQRIERVLSHPLYSGAIIMMCCIAPIDTESEQQIKLDAFFKEITTMDTSPYFPGLDFSCFFGNYNQPLHARMQPNPSMAKVVHKAINSWITKHTSGTIHRPTLSNKLLPNLTRQDMNMWLDAEMGLPELATQGTLEYLHMKYDVTVSGPCEIKQRWYTNGLSPRTYFVCGPTLYERSKYTKALWNDLVDQLTTTQRFNRVNARRIHIEGIERALFYDLSTFTSNCAAQREFLKYLARVVEGLSFNILDTRHGPMTVDFGDVIKDYCQTNIQPEYTDTNGDYRSVHGVAGFLGVYGNIATCTFLHGAFLLQLSSAENKCGCAGDDAVLVTVEEESTIWICVSLIGVIAREKTFSSDDPDVIYLKRRTWVDDHFCRLDFSTYIQLPSFLFRMTKRDIRRYRESMYTKEELLKLACNSLSAMYKSTVAYRDTTAFPDIKSFLSAYYKLLRIPETGFVPQFSHDSTRFGGAFIPHIGFLGEYDFILGTIQATYPGWCKLPSRPFSSNPMSLRLEHQLVYTILKSPESALLVKMGVLEECKLKSRMFYGQVGLDKLIAEYSGQGENSEFSTYMVVRDISEVPCPPEVFGEEDNAILLAAILSGDTILDPGMLSYGLNAEYSCSFQDANNTGDDDDM